MNKKTTKIVLLIIGILLLLNGVFNIIDEARVLVYDVTSLLSGIGFIVLSLFKKE